MATELITNPEFTGTLPGDGWEILPAGKADGAVTVTAGTIRLPMDATNAAQKDYHLVGPANYRPYPNATLSASAKLKLDKTTSGAAIKIRLQIGRAFLPYTATPATHPGVILGEATNVGSTSEVPKNINGTVPANYDPAVSGPVVLAFVAANPTSSGYFAATVNDPSLLELTPGDIPGVEILTNPTWVGYTTAVTPGDTWAVMPADPDADKLLDALQTNVPVAGQNSAKLWNKSADHVTGAGIYGPVDTATKLGTYFPNPGATLQAGMIGLTESNPVVAGGNAMLRIQIGRDYYPVTDTPATKPGVILAQTPITAHAASAKYIVQATVPATYDPRNLQPVVVAFVAPDKGSSEIRWLLVNSPSLKEVTPGTPPANMVPTIPPNVRGIGNTSRTIDIAWDDSIADAGISHYCVYRTVAAAVVGNVTTKIEPAASPFHDIGPELHAGLSGDEALPQLAPSTEYIYEVSCVDSLLREGPRSAKVHVRTQALAAPTAPAWFTVTPDAVNKFKFFFDWDTDIYCDRSPIGDGITPQGWNLFFWNRTMRLRQGFGDPPIPRLGPDDTHPPTYPANDYDNGNPLDNTGEDKILANHKLSYGDSFVGIWIDTSGVDTVSPPTPLEDGTAGPLELPAYGTLAGAPFNYAGDEIIFELRAFDAEGWQGDSIYATAIVGAGPPPPLTLPLTAPTALWATVNRGEVILAWTPGTDPNLPHEDGWDTLPTNVYRDGIRVNPAQYPVTDPYYVMSDLELDTEYTFILRSVAEQFGAGQPEGPPSVQVTVLTGGDTQPGGIEHKEPPDAPTGLVATNITSGSAVLTWEAALDDNGQAVYGYRAYSDTSNIMSGVLQSRTWTLTKLKPDTDYMFSVRSVDNGNQLSAASDPVVFRTLVTGEGPPPAGGSDLVPEVGPLVKQLSARVAAFVGSADDVELASLAEQSVSLVLSYIRGYTRGKGFSANETVPALDIQDVIVGASARLVANPEQQLSSVGTVTVRSAFGGFTLAERAVLNNYRARWA